MPDHTRQGLGTTPHQGSRHTLRRRAVYVRYSHFDRDHYSFVQRPRPVQDRLMSSAPITADPPTPLRVTARDLFTGFLTIGLQGFGGVLPWARRMIVEERHWL